MLPWIALKLAQTLPALAEMLEKLPRYLTHWAKRLEDWAEHRRPRNRRNQGEE